MKHNKNTFFPGLIAICLLILFFALFMRVVSMGRYPLFDTTEARYAGIALEMLKSGDWIVPSLPLTHEAFLAKPVLSFWCIAASLGAFGVNEFAARLPNLLETILILFFTYLIARKFYDKFTSLLAPCLLFTASFIFIQAGTVDLDVMLCLINTVSFWAYLNILQATERNNKKDKLIYETLLGILVALNLLNKGLIGLVLFGGSILLFSLWKKNSLLIFRVNWLLIAIIGVLLAAPWYLAAEARHPDFLKYFFLNEHFYRYLKKDYGDRYGTPHLEVHGTSLVFVLGAFMPWSPLLIASFNDLISSKVNRNNSAKFLWSCFLFPPVFFILVRSLLMNYILVSLPFIAILSARVIIKTLANTQKPIQAFQTQISSNKNIFWKVWMLISNPIYGSIPSLIASCTVMMFILQFYSMHYSLHLHEVVEKKRLTIYVIFLSIGAVFLFLLSYYKAIQKINPTNIKRLIKNIIILCTLVSSIYLSTWFAFFTHPLAEQKSLKELLSKLPNAVPNFQKHTISFVEDNIPASWFFYSYSIYKQLPLETTIKQSQAKHIELVYEEYIPSYCENHPERCINDFVFKSNKYFVFKPQSMN